MNRFLLLMMSSLGFGLLFATASLLFNFGQWKQLVLLLVAGLGIGVLVAPVFSPSSFENPMPLQAVGGAIAGFFGVWAVSNSVSTALVGVVIGIAIGATAPIWSKQIELP